MDAVLRFFLVAIPLAWLFAMAGYAYVDAGRHGMNPRKWAAISLFVPFFGFFAYIFERDEREEVGRPDRGRFSDGAYVIHESRLDEDEEEPPGNGSLESMEQGTREDEAGSR